MGKISIITNSSEETKEVAKSFAKELILKKEEKVVFLKGDLGSGKTTFVLGFLSYFKIKPSAASPTFVIMKKYPAKRRGFNIYHLDAYRLKSKNDLDLLGFDKIKNDKKSIVLIEWPERIKGLKVSDKILIDFSHGNNENERLIKFS